MKIGKYEAKYPLMQGGMGVRISGFKLAGNVALNGGIGLVAAAGLGFDSDYYKKGDKFFEADKKALADEIRKAMVIAKGGIVGVNIMYALTNFSDLVETACSSGANLIVAGAGLVSDLPKLTNEYIDVALIPIVSSVQAIQLVCKRWDKRYGRLPDAVVVEDPDTAGGHLGEKCDNIGKGFFNRKAVVNGVKQYFKEQFNVGMTVILAGGIWDKKDIEEAFQIGADGVQMASRFVCTKECDADENFKQAYIDCAKDDIGLIESPAGLPGRAIIKNYQLVKDFDKINNTRCSVACLKKCTYKDNKRERFCIMGALDRSQKGNTETGLVFCGTNAWRSKKISTVKQIIQELFE